MNNKKTSDEWLVMNYFIEKHEGFPAGAMMEKLFGRLTVSSGFNRTYLFDLYTGKIFEIKQ